MKSPYNLKTRTFMSEPKTVSLTLADRYAIINLFNQMKGVDVNTMRAILEDSKNVAISEEEFEKAGLKTTSTYHITENGVAGAPEVHTFTVQETKDFLAACKAEGKLVTIDPQSNLSWNDTEPAKEVTLQDPSVKYILGLI